jgi:hypothetical protein
MAKKLIGTTALLLALASLAALSPQRAAAAGYSSAQVVAWLKKGMEAAKHVQFTEGSKDLAAAIVRDGIADTPTQERSKGKLFPHYLVKTTKGATYKVKFKKVGPKMTITVTPADSSSPAESAPPKK